MFRQALRAERTALLWWSFALFLFLLGVCAGYSSFAESESFQGLDEENPEFAEAFGADSFTTVDGYLMSQAVALLPMLFGVYVFVAVSKQFAGAVETGRIDHLLSRPLTRGRYFGSVAWAVAIVAAIIWIATAAGTVLGYWISDVSQDDLVRSVGMLADTLPGLAYHFGLALLLGTFASRRSLAAGIGMGIVIGGFALSILARVVEATEPLKWINIYGLWDRSDLFHGEPDWIYWGVGWGVGILASLLARARWASRDL